MFHCDCLLGTSIGLTSCATLRCWWLRLDAAERLAGSYQGQNSVGPHDRFMHKTDEFGFVALNTKEQALIQPRWTSLEVREEVYAATARLRHLKPRVLES